MAMRTITRPRTTSTDCSRFWGGIVCRVSIGRTPAWSGPAILRGLDVVMQYRLRGAAPPLAEVLFVSGDWLLYAVLTPAVFAIASRWPLARPHLAPRAAL